MRWRRDERGSGSVLALGTVAALAAALAATLPLALLTPVKHRVKDAADAAALAAADVALGLTPGMPCEAAEAVTTGNGMSMLDCRVDGAVITVTAGETLLGMRLTAISTAGPAAERVPPRELPRSRPMAPSGLDPTHAPGTLGTLEVHAGRRAPAGEEPR